MGKTRIVYKTIDKTDPTAAEQGRRLAQEQNDRKLRQLEEKLRNEEANAQQQARRAAQEEHEREEQKSAKQKAREKREKEAADEKKRLLEEERASLKLKEDLLCYEFGNKIGKATFKDLSETDTVRIALIGPTGSGKSCFIGTVERSLYGEKKQTNFAQGSGEEGTILLDEYLNWHNVIKLLDTRGFFKVDESTTEECLNIMTGRIKAGEEIQREYDDENKDDNQAQNPGAVSARPAAKFSEQVHGVIFVVKANDPKLKEGTYLDRMKAIRHHFSFDGYSPVTVITCEDKLKNEEERDKAFSEASAATGSPRNRTYFISNYTHAHDECRPNTEKRAMDVLDTVLIAAERYVKIQKLRSHYHGDGGGDAKGSGESIKQLFARLQSKYHWDSARVAKVVQALEEQEVNTVTVLKDCWEDMKGAVEMSVPMRRMVEKELKTL